MSSRFFSESPIAVDAAGQGVVQLGGPEAHHLLHVMRAAVGDRVTLFDGSGAEYAGEVTALGRAEASVAVLAREEIDREAAVAVTLGVALPKGDRQKVLVEKLTEVGVARLTPLLTERSVVAPKAAALDKLRRLVVEASKQCGRNRLMKIEQPRTLADFFAENTDADERLLSHPGGTRLPAAAPRTKAAAIVVGPEGGFTDAETASATREGWSVVSLGSRVLRIETAAIVLAASRATPVGLV